MTQERRVCVRPPVQGSPAALPSLAAVPLHTTTQVVAQWSSLLTDGALPEVHTAWLEASTAHVCTTVGVFWLKGKPKASGANVASSAVTAHAKSLVAALGGPSFVPATKGHLGFKLASSVKPIEHLGSRIEFKPAGLNYHSWYYMNIPSTPDDAEGMAAEAKVIRVFLSRDKKAAGDSRAGMPMTLAVKGHCLQRAESCLQPANSWKSLHSPTLTTMEGYGVNESVRPSSPMSSSRSCRPTCCSMARCPPI